MTRLHDTDAEAFEPGHKSSATARVIEGLELHGFHPSASEPDPRLLPDTDQLAGAVSDIFDILGGALHDTALEPDLDDLLWCLTDLFHKKCARVQRQLEDNEDRQKRSQLDQDGSEIRSVELESLIALGQSLLERREAFEHIRDLAAERYETETGSAWRPRAGSLVNHKHLTAALIDSRDFIAARRKADTELLVPPGTKIAFSGGVDYADHKRIWAVLDKVHAKHPDMVLIHGGTPKGAEKAAACWADKRGVTQVAFKPDWTRDGKAAPFKRNDRMLEIVPAGVIVFPGSGITGNLADKAKQLRIPVLDHREGGA
jgi:YspA, cpYpsA-related SLOG family